MDPQKKLKNFRGHLTGFMINPSKIIMNINILDKTVCSTKSTNFNAILSQREQA